MSTVTPIRRRRPQVEVTNRRSFKPHPEVIDIKVGEAEIRVLRSLCDWYGPRDVAKQVEVNVSTLFRIMAGFDVRARPSTARAFKRFFSTYYAENKRT